MPQDRQEWTWQRVVWRGIAIAIVVVGIPALFRNPFNGPPMDYMIADGDCRDGHYDKGISEFTDLIKSNPDYISAYRGRGECYRLKGNYVHAIADFDEAIRRDTHGFEAYLGRCKTLQETGEIDRAITDCKQAASIKPDNPEPVSLLGRMLLARGDVQAARQQFDKAVALQTNYGDDNRFYRGQSALFYEDRPADAADDFVAALDRAFEVRDVELKFGDDIPRGDALPFIPYGYYLLVWQHIARARAGQDDTQELAANVKKLVTPYANRWWIDHPIEPANDDAILTSALQPWPGPLIALYLGKQTPEAIRTAAAATANPDTRRRRICDTDFYLGIRALEKGAGDEGRKLLQAAANGCPQSAPEGGFAKAALKRLQS